jgi:transposase
MELFNQILTLLPFLHIGFYTAISFLRKFVPPRRIRLRHVVGLVLRRTETLNDAEQQERDRLWTANDRVTQACELSQSFAQMVRQRASERLDGWLERTVQSGITPLAQFAASLRTTYAEVRAALELSWSSGHVEGQVNRLKLIKRQMYGRASFDLLRAMVLAPG